MAMGKPVVAFDLIETRVSAQEAALYATPNDEREYGDKIAQLFDDPELRRKLGEYGKQRVHSDLSWEFSVPHLLRAYRAAFRKAGKANQVPEITGDTQAGG
jgi:glycosyltransferase involved in cell wall biosynthesis